MNKLQISKKHSFYFFYFLLIFKILGKTTPEIVIQTEIGSNEEPIVEAHSSLVKKVLQLETRSLKISLLANIHQKIKKILEKMICHLFSILNLQEMRKKRIRMIS